MNVITRIIFPLCLLFTCLLVGCSPGSKPTSASSPAVTLQVLRSPTPPVVQVTPLISTANLEDQKLKDIAFSPCTTISPAPPSGNKIPWVLLAERASLYIIDPNTGVKSDKITLYPYSNSNSPVADDFSLSPDGKWLAYDLYGENDVSLVVEPSDNLLTRSSEGRIIWNPEKSFLLQGWLSNESVVLTIHRGLEGFASTLIRNPFNEEEHEFFLEELPNYLDHQPGMSGADLFAHSNLMPDATLERVAYPATNDHLMVALWDVKNKKVLTRLRLFFDEFYNDPLWSLDGSDFIIMGIDNKGYVEWFQVTRDGAIKQLTHFGEFLKDVKFENPGRSPDGRYLAFQLIDNADTGKDKKYLILDLKSQSPDGFCIDYGEKLSPDKPLAWSPDSRYVAITNGTIAENSAVVILVDLEKREAFQVGQDVHAIGWMVKP